MDPVKVISAVALPEAAKDLISCVKQAEDEVGRRLAQVEKLHEDTRREEQISRGMLEAAKAAEAVAAARTAAASAAATRAASAQAAAIATGNPALIVSAGAATAKAAADLAKATSEYDRARTHRRRLEHRHELSVRCLRTMERLCDELRLAFRAGIASMKVCAGTGSGRLLKAYEELRQYNDLPDPLADVVKVSSVWRSYSDSVGTARDDVPLLEHGDESRAEEKSEEEQTGSKQPVRPDEIWEKFNMSEEAMLAILAQLFATDSNFRIEVLSYRIQAESLGAREPVELKIKKNMAGRLSEEMAKRVFGPLGEQTETQGRTYMEDGSYTKTDLIVRNLKVPLILGRGKGMGSREGSDLAVEVKSGKKEYLWHQMSHMEFQAQGHKGCDISCTVCSRDIKDLGPERETALRSKMREAGSPIIGMLPYKRDIDNACIKFVFGGEESV